MICTFYKITLNQTDEIKQKYKMGRKCSMRDSNEKFKKTNLEGTTIAKTLKKQVLRSLGLNKGLGVVLP
jgi:translation elongation factor EF-G